MTGGLQADRFIFQNHHTGATIGSADRITDFDHAEGDLIDLAQVDANTGTPANDPFSFIGTAAFSNVAGELRYEQSGGNTWVQGDTDGNAVADFMIRLDGLHTLTAADFVL